MINNSSRTEQAGTLAAIKPERLEGFLQALANARAPEHAERLLKLYSPFFPPLFTKSSKSASKVFTGGDAAFWSQFPGDFRDSVAEYGAHLDVLKVAPWLRKAWDEPDQRLKEWYSFELRRKFHAAADPEHADHPPALTPFEQAIFYFQRISTRAKHCANPDCPAPYFLAAKRSYKYCSDACALPAQQAFKREWWALHGEDWRKSRETSRKKKGAKKNAKR